LRRGGPTATVTEKDFIAAARSPHYIECKEVALAIRMGAAPSRRHYLDLPAADHSGPDSLGQEPSYAAKSAIRRHVIRCQTLVRQLPKATDQRTNVCPSLKA
jgi:hypothetical protein